MGLTNEQEILESYELNTFEKNIIKKYRHLDDHGKEMVDFTLEKEYERSIAPQIPIAAHNDNSEPGQIDLMREDIGEL